MSLGKLPDVWGRVGRGGRPGDPLRPQHSSNHSSSWTQSPVVAPRSPGGPVGLEITGSREVAAPQLWRAAWKSLEGE